MKLLVLAFAFNVLASEQIHQKHIEVLTSDEYMGRGPGTEGHAKAVSYISNNLNVRIHSSSKKIELKKFRKIRKNEFL